MPYPVRATGQNPYGPQVEFRTEEVLPPSALYLSMDDTLVAQVQSSAVNPAFTFSVRMLLADGTIQSEIYNSQQNLPVTTEAVVVIPPVEGYLLSCVAVLNSTVDGSCWMWIRSFKGIVQLPIITLPPASGMLIAQGELDQQTFVAWPNTPADAAGTGAGRMRNITGSAGAGVNWIVQTSSNQRWELVAVQMTLTTSAAAVNRYASLVIFDRLGNSICRFPANFAQTASTQVSYYFYNGAPEQQIGAFWATAPFPQGVYLDPGMQLQSGIRNMDTGDSTSFVNVLVREWMGVGHA